MASDLTGMHICFVGNMLGRNHGYVTTQGQIVADLLEADGFQVTCISSKINRVWRSADIVTSIMRGRRKFDLLVLEVYSGLSFAIADAASILGRALGIPVIMVLHGGHLHEFVSQNQRWARRVLDRADQLVAPSAFLSERFGALGYETARIANVIDIESYTFRERTLIEPNLIWMRSFHPIYNPDMAIDVLFELRRKVPNATLTMAGVDKGQEQRVKQAAKDKGLSEAVRFPGFLDAEAKAREFSSADVYLNTNRIDNMPVSVIEACAFGLPVVATNVGGLPHLIDHRKNGMLVPDGDVAAMTQAVMELLNDRELTNAVSNGARELAERSSWLRVREDWIELFEKTIRNGRATRRNTGPNAKLVAEIPQGRPVETINSLNRPT